MALARWQETIVDEFGNVQPLALIEVRQEVPGQPLVALFSDRDGLVSIGNPFLADADGFAFFHVAGGAYQIVATLGAFSRTWRYVGVGTASEGDLDAAISDAMIFMGVIDCSANPNYPAADRGHTYRVSVAGKIGGASGTNVEVGDLLVCLTDGTVAGTQAAVGASWTITQANLDGAVIGPASAVDGTPMVADGATGKLIKNITYAAFKTLLVLVKGDVGLGSVDNTADTAKPVSTAQQTALDLKANLASPTLTGTPAAPTAAPGTNTTQLSTTAFVKAAIDVVLGGVSSSFDTLVEIVAGFIPNSLLTTRGDIIYRNATVPARLAKGSSGQVLTMGAEDPGWAAPAAAGASTALDNLASVAINTGLLLGTSDGGALGSATKQWSDLFLSTGAVINFNNGAETITHAANTLTFAGANYVFNDGNLIVAGDIVKGVDNSQTAFYGGSTFDGGAGIVLYGESHATKADIIAFHNTNFTERMRIAAAGNVYMIGVATTAGVTPLAILDSGSTPTNELLRSTSSLRYKCDVEPLKDKYADQILSLNPIWYRSKCEGDDPTHSFYGLAAEEVAAIDPRLVSWEYLTEDMEVLPGEDGKNTMPTPKKGAKKVPGSVAYATLPVLMIPLIKRMQTTIDALEHRVSELEKKKKPWSDLKSELAK